MPLKFKPGTPEYKEYHRNWNNKNRPGTQTNKIEKREWVKQLKIDRGCDACSISNPATLQFHHRDTNTKDNSISVMIRDNRPYEIIQNEINKCDLLCANCHAKITFEARGYGKIVGKLSSLKYVQAREWIRNIKDKSCCSHCEYNDPSGLHFHHVDPLTKIDSVANGVSNGWPVEKLQSESDKCIILCANCHFILHHGDKF